LCKALSAATTRKNKLRSEALVVSQQSGMLNLRISDMMTQLKTVLKTMIDENKTLKKENAELKNRQEKTSKT
jgi:regulator of replication initiation timing